jgi:alkylation response protein AidB-like acyl-CoA dehydrogenase
MQNNRSFDELDAVLLERARGLAPVLRQHAPEGERTCRTPRATVQALGQAGFLKLWRPRSLGGHEVDPITYAVLAELVSAEDTAAGWLMMSANNAAFDMRIAPPSWAERVYADVPEALVIATYNRPMHAEAVDGGVTVSGKAGFASGCHDAHWIAHTAWQQTPEGGRMLLVYHPRAALQLVEDWDTLGMRGTSSNSIVAERCFVPSDRVVDLASPAPFSEHYRGALYRCPLGLVSTSIAAVSLGAVRSALAALRQLAETKVPFASAVPLKHRALAQLHYGRALATYRAARSYLHDQLALTWQRALAADGFGLEQKADLWLASAHVLGACADAVRDVASAAGTSSVYKSSPIERAVRDLETLRHHALGAEGRFASVAQALWGVEIDFPFLAVD